MGVDPICHSEVAGTSGDSSSHNTSTNSNDQKARLLRKCGQTDTMPFDQIYSKRWTQNGIFHMTQQKDDVKFFQFNSSVLKKCRKIGEGVFGEVFLNHVGRSSYVLKIIPIEGIEAINGAQQKRFDEILQEVIISQELSALRHDCDNNNHHTTGFVEVLNVRLVEGRYPVHLLDLWKVYDKVNGSENECPEFFGEKQLYIVFELTNSGVELEKYLFKNVDQSYSVFKQVISIVQYIIQSEIFLLMV